MRNDFRTDVDPTLFIDNWGTDVVAHHGDKIKAPIDAAVALAQLMASIRNGTPLDPDSLDCEALDDVLFLDGSNRGDDHFFSVSLEPRFNGGSYAGPRVSAAYTTGSVRIAPVRQGNSSMHVNTQERWSTKRGDVISARAGFRFGFDLDRLNGARAILERVPQDELVTERPETWPGKVPDLAAYEADLIEPRAGTVRQLVYLGKLPSQQVIYEPVRRPVIPFLDSF